MAKENLPYFKFLVTEWLTGDIVLEEFDIQGLFVNICALYWKKQGQLKMEDLAKRYPNKANAFQILTDRFISVNDGYVDIKFLNEQLTEFQLKSIKNSRNGSKGGRPKASKTQDEKANENPNKANAFISESEKKPNKSKSKSKEEDTINTDSTNQVPKVLSEYEVCVSIWKNIHPDFVFNGLSGKKMKSIIEKIKALLKSRNKEVRLDTVVESFSTICKKLPEWYKGKDLAIIDSKFNEIIEEIKNPKKNATTDRITKHIATTNEVIAKLTGDLPVD